MPPSSHTASQSSYRRSTASARQRENRTHSTPNSNIRRRKSRSPEARVLEHIPPGLMATESDSHRRKRKGVASFVPSVSEPVSQHSVEEFPSERGRRSKAKARQQSFVEEGGVLVLREYAAANSSTRSKRKERSKSRDTQSRGTHTASPEPTEVADVGMPLTALDSIEFIRTKREIESLRKQLQQSKKTIHKQSKVIDELKLEAANSAKSQKEQAKEMDKLKAQSKKSEELVANLEMNLSCQICMEILARPHGLSPCGHVLCQGCLQNWFRSAPPGDDEMFDEDEPDALIYRRKTCPCCRTVVTSRPIPLFVVKSLTSVLEKAKAHPCAPRRPTPPPDDDPWEGIFSDPESQVDFRLMDEDEDDGEDEDDDDEDDDYDAEYDDWSYDDEDEDYHGSYVRQRWEPPTVHATLEDYPFHDVDEHDLRMLRRGATLQMIDTFEMSYTHEDGLCVRVDGDNVVYLGWNIYLHPQDESGEAFIDWIMSDMHRRPRRWEADEERNGPWTAWRLVHERDEQDYETTDSETWAADLAEDEDF